MTHSLLETKSATVSACGRYRYDLTREWEPQRGASRLAVCWILLNPSTADAHQDDPTIRRVREFTRAWGYNSFTVVNLFAWRATKPRELSPVADPIGPENDVAIARAVRRADLVVAAWGAHTLARQPAAVLRMRLADTDVYCLGTTRDGSPRHPLFVRADTKLERLW